MEDHKGHFRIKWGEGALLLVSIAALLVILWLVWEAFG
jgi:hypothetical protein